MSNTVLMIGIILATITIIGYIAFENKPDTEKIIQTYVPPQAYQVFQTGDVASLSVESGGPNSNTQTFVYSNPTNQSSKTGALALNNGSQVAITPDTSNMSIQAGQTYGTTSLYSNTHLEPDAFKIGTPVKISGTFKMVVPNSCVLVDGKTQCDYVSPPIFNYLVEITCKIPENDHCSMPDEEQYKKTDGAGNYEYTWNTSSTVNLVNAGEYLIRISATSQVVNTSGVPFPIVLEKHVFLVN